MSKVKRWYIGVYGGEAQARGCKPHAREIIRETQGEIFVLDADFERVDAERDALQQRLTAADERADVLEGLLREARHNHGVMLLSDPPRDAWKHHRISERIDETLNAKSR
jgi:hypothetical protein